MRNGGASSADEFVELLEADLPNAKRLATQHVVPIALKIMGHVWTAPWQELSDR